MLYAILCYNDEEIVGAWSKDYDDHIMARLDVVHRKLAREGRFTGAARLLPTTAATSLRKGDQEPVVLDGPFVETKEQLLGFYVVDCADLDQALETARDLAEANPGVGGYEVRPVAMFVPGSGLS